MEGEGFKVEVQVRYMSVERSMALRPVPHYITQPYSLTPRLNIFHSTPMVPGPQTLSLSLLNLSLSLSRSLARSLARARARSLS